MGLLDQVNRSGLEKALPVLSRMVADGDLDRLAQLARVYSSAEDALTDEMVGRIAETVGEGLSLLDRLSRGGAGRLVEMMEHMEASGALERVATTLPKLLERMDHLEQLLNCVDAAAADTASAGLAGAVYEFEPSEEEILAELLPNNLAVQLYTALLENAASEQGARMTAMDNATRNAGDMIDRLTMNYNRTRQAVITKELIEIISGAEAL